jgi:hypothetical protein
VENLIKNSIFESLACCAILTAPIITCCFNYTIILRGWAELSKFYSHLTFNPHLISSTILNIADIVFKEKWAGIIGYSFSVIDTWNFFTKNDYKIELALYHQIATDFSSKNNGSVAFLSNTRSEVEAKFTFAFAWMKAAVDAGHIKIMTGAELKTANTYQYTYYDAFCPNPGYYTMAKTKPTILQSYHLNYYRDDQLSLSKNQSLSAKKDREILSYMIQSKKRKVWEKSANFFL